MKNKVNVKSLFRTSLVALCLLTIGVGNTWAGTKRIYAEYSAVSSWWGNDNHTAIPYIYAWGGGHDAKKYTMTATGTSDLAYCDIDDYHTDFLFYRSTSQDGSWTNQTVDISIGSNNRWSILDSQDGSGHKYTGSAQRWTPSPAIDGLLDPKNPHNQMFTDGTYSTTLEAHKTYEFKILETSTLYGLNDLIATSSISNQTLNTSGYQVRLCTAGAGTYTFTYNSSTHTLSIAYPATLHPSLDYCYVIDYSWSPSANLHLWNGTSTKVAEWNGESTIAGSTWPGAAISNKTTINGQSYFYIAPGEYANFLVSKNGDGTDRSGDLTTSDGYGKRRYYNGSSWVWDTFTVRIQLNDLSATTAVDPTYMDVAFNSDVLTDLTSVPVKTHYDFGGFYTGYDDVNDVATGTQVINADGEWIASVADYTDASKHWIHAGTSTTLYAKWTEIRHDVTVAVSPAGAGSVQVSGSPITSVENIGYETHSAEMTAVPTNAAWRFKEWQVTSNAHLDLEHYTTTGTTMKITATDDDQTLTAVFEPRYYLVGGEIMSGEDGVGIGTSSGMPGWDNYNEPFEIVTNSPILATCSLSLGTNKNFYIMVRDKSDGYSYGKSGGVSLGDGTSLKFENKDNRVFFYSNGGTDYTFKITDIDGSGRPTVSVERPYQVNIGRKRVDIDGNDHDDNTGGTVDLSKQTAPETWTPISNGDWVPYGISVKYNASKEDGYTLDWYTASDYATQFTTEPYWFHTATRTGNGYAKFTEISTSVTLANDGNGKVQIGGVDATSTTCGVTTTRSLTAVPDDGYMFSSWTKTSGDDITLSFTSTNPTTLTGLGSGATSGQTVTANFTERWQLKAESVGWGSATFTISNISTVGGDAVGYVDISLSANTNYQFTIVDLQESATYKNGSDQVYYMTNGNSHNWTFATDKTYNCGITTAGAGTYRFTWNITDKTMSVTYPNFVIYRSGDKAGDPRATGDDVESYAGGTISEAIEFRMRVNRLDKWYTLCLPFTVSAVKVWDEEDGAYYDIVPYYRETEEGSLQGGHYIIRTPKTATNLAITEFGDWRDPTSPTGYKPSANTPYIIQWHMSYFNGKYISFFGATGQTIPTSMTAGTAQTNDNKVNVCVNNSMTSGSVTGAYLLDPDYGEGAWLRGATADAVQIIAPFECYLLANSTTRAKYRVIRRDMTITDTPTGWEDVLNSERKAQITVYTISGFRVAQFDDCSYTEAATRLRTEHGEGIYILRADNESVKLMVGRK